MRITCFVFRISLIFLLIIGSIIICQTIKKEKNTQTNIVNSHTSLITTSSFQDNHNNYHDTSSIKVLSYNEMINLKGGSCGSGTCNDYPHTCAYPCVHLDAKQCGSGAGNCVNGYWVVLCICGSSTIFTSGCL